MGASQKEDACVFNALDALISGPTVLVQQIKLTGASLHHWAISAAGKDTKSVEQSQKCRYNGWE